MTLYLVVPFLFAIAILQTSAVPHLTVWGVFPDVPVLVVASWGLLRGRREGAIWGLIGGMAVDLLSGLPAGAATLSLIAVGLLSGLAQTSAFRQHGILPVITIFLATIAYDLVTLLILGISGSRVLWLDSLIRIVLPSAVLNGALAPMVYWTMRSLYARFGSDEMGR